MAVPAPAIPSGNAYTVNVGHAPGPSSPLPAFSAAAALLLRRWKVSVRMHVSGDNAPVNALRASLNAAGAKPSAFSPAPSAEIPGEGFWKTTATVVEAGPDGNFWAEERADKKVEWDPLLIALADRVSRADLPSDLAGLVGVPDLWCVASEATAADWIAAGAKAVCVLAPEAITWKSGGSVFGRSEGTLARGPASPENSRRDLGIFAAGLVSGMIRELLGENLFDKTLIRADRECLEMRPLRLGRAAWHAAAALEAVEALGKADATLIKGSGLAEETETRLAQLRGPESKPWAHKGR